MDRGGFVSKFGFGVVLGALLGSSAFGCSDEAAIVPSPGGDPAGSAPDGTGDAGARGSAILVAAFVLGLEEDRSIYVGAAPEVPEGELDYSSFLEFGNVDVSTYGGYVFVWERDPAIMTRYTVEDDLSLTRGPSRSFFNYGVGGGGELVYVSETRAYILSPQLDTIVVWNPVTLEITGTIPVDFPQELRSSGFAPFAHKGQVVGDSVVWQIIAANFDSLTIHPGVVLAIASSSTDEPVRFIEDDRCIGGDGGYVDARGDYYVRAGGYWGYFAAYGPAREAARTCVLKLPAGSADFDPDYLVDMRELTGTYLNFPWFHVEGSTYLTQVWDPAVALPENPNDYYLGAGLEALLVDIEAGSVEPYPDIDGTIPISSNELALDGVAYYEWSDQGLGAGSTQVMELRRQGLVPKFSLPSLWALGRIR
jgi:hypothetical protein